MISQSVIPRSTNATTFHANARMRNETDFATAMDSVPSTPTNTWL